MQQRPFSYFFSFFYKRFNNLAFMFDFLVFSFLCFFVFLSFFGVSVEVGLQRN